MTTYTFMKKDGEFISSNNSADDVVVAALNYDGEFHEVRQDADGYFQLFAGKNCGSYTMPLTACVGWTGYAGVQASNFGEAWALLSQKAFESGLPGAGITFMTDEDYNASMGE